MTTASVTTVGDSLAVVLPLAVQEKLSLAPGDQVSLVETPNGFEVQRCDRALTEQIAALDQVMREDEHALRRLAQ